MTQLVFVHGVATRRSPAYDREESTRDDLFRKISFAGSGSLEILNSYWGDDGSSLAWDQASLPMNGQGVQAFSLLGGFGSGGAPSEGKSLAAIADKSFPAAADGLMVAMVDAAVSRDRALSDEETAVYAAVTDYAARNPVPDWLDRKLSDAEFIEALRSRLPPPVARTGAPAPASFGLGDVLTAAGGALVDRARNLVGQGLTNAFRDELNPAVARFLGDVFVYLRDGQRRDAIRSGVVADLKTAHARRRSGESLVVIGHSLGGVILYDLMSKRPADLPADLTIDLLVTAGSQSGLFEELKLFPSSDPAIPSENRKKALMPAGVSAWLNVYDPIDLFGFRAAPMFEGCEDFTFNSVTGLVDAHTAYFKRPQFHGRLTSRLKTAGIK